MAFDNHYPNRKDWREAYYGSARFDPSCRPGGSCPCCRSARAYQHAKQIASAADQLRTFRDSIADEKFRA